MTAPLNTLDLPAEAPDIMNDPAYETNTRDKQKGAEEPDTCRICRGEATDGDPLFYPCKCSGSIKFVHQSCLLEWLSHTQRKHCELCKTSFRFTKLYHPQMPSTVPLPIFLRQAAVHAFKSVLTWTRWHLVIFVWLGWVPWSMRTVWRGLFYVGDGLWINWEEIERSQQAERMSIIPGTSPANTGLLESTTSGVFPGVWRGSPVWDLTSWEDTISRLGRSLFHIISPSTSQNISTIPPNPISTFKPIQRSPSLLSDVKFLSTLTRWRTVNNWIIDALEGQLITLFVVTAFILVFLIREWVVQQQPAINMGALPEVEAAAAVAQDDDVPALPPPDLHRRQFELDIIEQRLGNAQGFMLDDEVVLDPARIPVPQPDNRVLAGETARLQRRIAAPRPARGPRVLLGEEHPIIPREWGDIATGVDSAMSTPSLNTESTVLPRHRSQSLSDAGPSSNTQRPGMPTKHTLARASEIRRTLEEESRVSGQDWPGLDVFMAIWKRGDSNPEKVLRIIEQEHRGEDLAWIVAAMKKLQTASSDSAGDLASEEIKVNQTAHVEQQSIEQQSDTSNESWLVVDENFLPENSTSKHTEQSQEQINPFQLPPESDGEVTGIINMIRDVSGGRSRVKSEEQPILDPETEGLSENQTQSGPSSAQSEATSNDLQPVTNVDLASSVRDTSEASHQIATNAQSLELELEIPQADAIRPESAAVAEPTSVADIPETEDNSRADGVAVEEIPAMGYAETLRNWLWGGIHPPDVPLVEVVEAAPMLGDVWDDPPLEPADHEPVAVANFAVAENAAQDPEVLQAAAEAGLDPNDVEAVEDGEDLEGVMELIGMQGPIAGLVQNGMFSAVLISLSLLTGVWVPYIMGKLVLVFIANPVSLLIKLPLRSASTTADLIIDTCIIVTGCTFYWLDVCARWICTPVGWVIPSVSKLNEERIIGTTAWSYISGAAERLSKMFVATGDSLSESDIPVFSIVAHESLQNIEQAFGTVTETVGSALRDIHFPDISLTTGCLCVWHNIIYRSGDFVALLKTIILKSSTLLHVSPVRAVDDIGSSTRELWQSSKQMIANTPLLLTASPLRINLDIPQRTSPLDYGLASWSTRDRVIAIILGYLFLSVAGAVYLKIKAALHDVRDGEKVEGAVAEILYQAGGVMKVILIISIEMIVFPLYCGLLLDAALLPLFEDATLVSRIQFTLSSPATSLFVHWFVGTCYMFNFALFVSMCRKIMRNGVLYFIRDPDDPTFHPVRDVLERNISTQLRKIAFSGLVYGALVLVCLGSVVWTLYFGLEGVFPIHWSSNEPVLEFPVDLLVYNFIMPVAVKFFKPSSGLKNMYNWWFRRCARWLRLSHFLFGDKKEDEEGYTMRRTWRVVQWLGSGRVEKDEARYVCNDGRLVRAPNSDAVRIPKDAKTFVDLDEVGHRADGLSDNHSGLHGRHNKLFTTIYVPPHFRTRICAFIVLLWLFASITGVGVTVVPLLFGRYIFAKLTPSHLRMNDVYAFAIGIYLLGSPVYLAVRYRKALKAPVITAYQAVTTFTIPNAETIRASFHHTVSYTIRVLRLFYFYTAFAIVLPTLLAFIMEFYLITPLHTYFSQSHSSTITAPHTIHFIQDWTLGVLYLKVAGRIILWNRTSRPALALRALVKSNTATWLNPDIRLATRAFIFPATIIMLVALALPLGVGWIANSTWFYANTDTMHAVVYRYSYPTVLGLGLAILFTKELQKTIKGWRMRIRDEVYLVGERLHNLGERRAPVALRART